MIKMEDNLYELRQFIFKYYMKIGYEYIARDKDGTIYAYSCKPSKREKAWVIDKASADGKCEDISLLSHIFTDIEWEDVDPFRIPYVNWEEVPVDTKVIVTGEDGSEWKGHFCKKYDCSTVSVFHGGKTSWTATKTQDIDIRRVRLA